MISSRSYYSADVAAELCRRSGQGLSSPHPQSFHADNHSDAIDGLHCRLSPSADVDGKPSSGQARRRIAVACQRCRKRKIKCSGDPGNGQGCSNCRGAGAAPSLCTFLRVNSRECDTYFTVRGIQGAARYNPYPSNQSVAARGGPMQLQSGNLSTGHFVNMPGGYDCYNGLYGQSIARASYPAYPINYEDDAYNSQSPAFILPNSNESILSSSGCIGPPPSPRNWDVFSSSGKTQHGLYPDPGPTNSVSLSSGSFPNSGVTFGSNTSDISSSLSSNSGMASSISSLDRILPNPVIGRSQQSGGIVTGANSLEGLPQSQIGYRSSLPWAGSDGTSGSSHSSDRIMSISYGSTVDSSGGSGESSTTSQGTPFAYIPLSHPSPGVSTKSPTTLLDPHKSDPTRKGEVAIAQNRARALSQESTPSSESNLTETYGYSCDIPVGRRSARGSISNGTLSNGQQYTRPRPLATPTSEMYRNTPQHESTDYRSQLPHRTSISSLSSSARY